MKLFFSVILCIFTFSIVGFCQCQENFHSLYDKENMLQQFESILEDSIPAYAQFPGEFFVYDLSDPINYYKSPTESKRGYGCINFADNHIYHFSPYNFPISESHIAILENGKLKVFNSINCKNSEQRLLEVIEYIEEKLKNNKNDDILTRLRNYRSYGFYFTVDQERVYCSDTKIPENSDKTYNRNSVLLMFSLVLKSSVSENATKRLSKFLVEESRANGFFVYDLIEPSNKQTSLLERVEFKNNHIYHFAFIDAPFSFSHIAILENGNLKIFSSINCEGKGDSLKVVISYLNEKLKNNKNKKEIIKRVKNYRKYGVYAPFNGLSTPQCEEVISNDNK